MMMIRLSGEKLKNNHMISFQLLSMDIAMLQVRYLKKYLTRDLKLCQLFENPVLQVSNIPTHGW